MPKPLVVLGQNRLFFEFCRKRLYAGEKSLEEVRRCTAAMGECVNTRLDQKVAAILKSQRLVLTDVTGRLEQSPLTGDRVKIREKCRDRPERRLKHCAICRWVRTTNTEWVDARKEYSDWAAKVTPPDSTFITVHPPI